MRKSNMMKNMKKKGYAMGGKTAMKKKGYAMGGMTGAYDPVQADMQRQQGMMQAQQPKPAMKNGGMMKKKKGYAKGGKVMTYNLGCMVKSQTDNRKKNNKK